VRAGQSSKEEQRTTPSRAYFQGAFWTSGNENFPKANQLLAQLESTEKVVSKHEVNK
jgi:hypothetical protein